MQWDNLQNIVDKYHIYLYNLDISVYSSVIPFSACACSEAVTDRDHGNKLDIDVHQASSTFTLYITKI